MTMLPTPHVWRLVMLQIGHYKRSACRPNVPEWFETQRKTTHVIFWN